ncbi:hypothetical protein NE865_06729 [Phthorimaea operculella]|nr:hypothetical protein NE865_06729 [Phthorimaea operculella]
MWAAWLILSTALVGASAVNYLLPSTVKPLHYDLRLVYDIDPASNFSMFGCVDILIKPTTATSKIVLHVENLSIPDNGIILKGVSDIPEVTKWSIDKDLSFLTIELSKELDMNTNYTLTIPFYGNTGQSLDGPYISTYVDRETKNKEPYLIAVNYTLTIPFYGNTGQSLDGPYISTYVDRETKHKE